MLDAKEQLKRVQRDMIKLTMEATELTASAEFDQHLSATLGILLTCIDKVIGLIIDPVEMIHVDKVLKELLDSFRLQSNPCRETLSTYLNEYPEYRDELLKLSVKMSLISLTDAAMIRFHSRVKELRGETSLKEKEGSNG